MPLEQRFLNIADRFLELIKRETGFSTIVCDETGTIVRATIWTRVGQTHPVALKVLREETNERATTAEEAAANPLLKEGVTCPMVLDGRRVGTFGITGPLDVTRPLARVAAVVLAKWLEDSEQAAAAWGQEKEDTRRAHLLCVDSSASTLKAVKEQLQGQYEVTLVGNGIEGLQAAKANPPHVVLCDFDRPELNGPQLLVAMKKDPALKAIPFVALTASTHQEAAARSLAAGADDFLPKCFGPDELRARVEAAVRTYRTYQRVETEHQNLTRMMTMFARSEARTRAVIESALDGIVLLGVDGKIQGLNASAEEIFGWSQVEAVGRAFLEEFVAPKSRGSLAEALARRGSRVAGGATSARWEVHGLRRQGQQFPMECNFKRLETGSGAGICAFVRDLTEARRMEVELQQAQKLEAVGRLSAGIAHEINTPIQFIGDNTHFLQEAFVAFSGLLQKYAESASAETRASLSSLEQELDLEYLREQVPKTIDRTLQGVQRVATIVRAMKEFAHPDQGEMVAADLNRALQATLEVARNEYKYVADIETDLGDLPLVTCHASEINQVLLNIIVNGAHAIAEAVKGSQSRGRIRISTRREGSDVLVAISDTGTGIPEAIRDKVFDPFFTTKDVGRGTGQGLTIARTIVAKHRGSIRFETDPGRGTTFLIRIPIDGSPSPSACPEKPAVG